MVQDREGGRSWQEGEWYRAGRGVIQGREGEWYRAGRENGTVWYRAGKGSGTVWYRAGKVAIETEPLRENPPLTPSYVSAFRK